MKRLDLTYITTEAGLEGPPTRDDFDRTIDEPTAVYAPNGDLLLAIDDAPEKHLCCEVEAKCCEAYDRQTAAMATRSQITEYARIGHWPKWEGKRNPPRKTKQMCSCGITQGFGIYVAGWLANILPAEKFLAQGACCGELCKCTDGCCPPGHPFTTALVVKNRQLVYHRFAECELDTWSVDLYCQRGVTGGEVVFPRWRIAVAPWDGCVLSFRLGNVLHGNMPLTLKEDACRTVIAYHANKLLGECAC